MHLEYQKHKVVYVLPEYARETDTHYAYLYSFIERVSGDLNLFVVVEKGERKPAFTGVEKVFTKKSRSRVGKLIEGFFLFMRARKTGYCDYYVHYSFIGALSAILVTRIFGGRVFYWNCGMPWLYERPWIRERIFRFILRNTILVTGATTLRDIYVDQYGLKTSNTRIVPNWIDFSHVKPESKKSARQKLHIPSNARVVLFVHHLSRRKGADMIIPVAREMPDTLFVVVGDGPYRDMLVHEAKELGNVRVEGAIPHSGVGRYFSAADVFFMPSEEEGFPHVILESLAYGVPYVASDVGAVRDISPAEQQPFVITTRDVSYFVDALRKTLDKPVSAHILRKYVERFDIAQATGRFVALFK